MRRTDQPSGPKYGARVLASALGLFACAAIHCPHVAGESARFFAVEATATTQLSPPKINLNWRSDSYATSYVIQRKLPSDATWNSGTMVPGIITSYSDESVSVGLTYEYKITKLTSADYNYTGYGYLYAGLDVPLVENRGKIILVVDNTYATDLAAELARLHMDLIGDGWGVIRHDVSRQDRAPAIKALIKRDYDSDPANVRAVLLFGNIAVPYSGDIDPDGHAHHQGAWPADAYYGELDGIWTDTSVTSTKSDLEWNWNFPGDGKFDQSSLPSDVDLEVGRVDLSDLTNFSNKTPARYERDLLRAYLNKNHEFRHGRIRVERRALIADNFSVTDPDPLAGGAWRSFASFFGPDGIVEAGWGEYFPIARSQSFLWSYGSGGGGFVSAAGVGTSDDFAVNEVQVVFTLFLGSYFGDWNTESNFLRSPLGSGKVLAAAYAGFPQWVFHPMGMGQTIGYCTRLSQNNGFRGLYPPHSDSNKQVHVALMGDPTLRMHPVIAPSDLQGTVKPGQVNLAWGPSSDFDLRGYHVYRAASVAGPFVRLTRDPIGANSFTDLPLAGTAVYMVRAVKLERSAGGTYFNGSQGIFFSTRVPAGTSPPPPPPPPPPTPVSLSQGQFIDGNFSARIGGQVGQRFAIETSSNFVDWHAVLTNTLQAPTFEFVESKAPQVTRRFYRARSLP